MVTHSLPQMPPKNGQIPQSAHSRQGTSLRRGSVERDADAECPTLSSRHVVSVTRCLCAVAHWTLYSASCLRTISIPISGHLSCYVIYLPFPEANLDWNAKLGDRMRSLACVGVRHDPAPSHVDKRWWQEPEPKTGATIGATDLTRMRSNAGTLDR